MARKRARSSASAKAGRGRKKPVTAAQKSARRKNIAVARQARKKGASPRKGATTSGFMKGRSGKKHFVDVLHKGKGEFEAYVGHKKIGSSGGLKVTRHVSKKGRISTRERNAYIRNMLP